MEPLSQKLETLKLHSFLTILESIQKEDIQKAKLIEQALHTMADEALRAKSNQAVQRRIQQAQFIQIQTVDAFNFDYNPSTRKLKKRYSQLIIEDPIKQARGAVFIGSAGLGKTHLARALGYEMCQKEYSVLYRICSQLANELVAAKETHDLEKYIKKLTHYRVLIIDEVGYLDMTPNEANLFFQVISRRHDKGYPTVVTSNKPFSEWNQTFHGDATAHAIVDRLTENAEIFYVEGKSYRQSKKRK